jgi:hypothetical protein
MGPALYQSSDELTAILSPVELRSLAAQGRDTQAWQRLPSRSRVGDRADAPLPTLSPEPKAANGQRERATKSRSGGLLAFDDNKYGVPDPIWCSPNRSVAFITVQAG